MKVLVTGATGLLGHHIVTHLQKSNEQVRIIVRSTSKLTVDTESLEIVKGDFTSASTLQDAVDGCDAVIHSAAVTATNLLKPDEYFRVNTAAVSTLLKACKQAKVKRLIYVSTVNTLGYGSEVSPADETTPISKPFTDSWYAQSKRQTELLLEKEAANRGIEVIIIHPAFMIGSHDSKPSSGRLIVMGYRKRLMLVPKGGKNFVSVQKVALACCNALYKGESGEHYLVGGENLSFQDFYKRLKRVGAYPQKLLQLPDWLILLAGRAGDLIRWMGIPVELSTRNVRQLLIREYYSSTKADTVLELSDAPVDTAIADALEWFRLNGKL